MTVRGWCFATALPLALACSHAQKKEAAAAEYRIPGIA